MFEFILYVLGKCLFFCAAIAGDTFPRPLTDKEEAKLLAAARNGDKDAREKLISHNLRLVAHVVKKYRGAYENEDLISVGTLGLIKAVDTYNEDKGSRLATYTARWPRQQTQILTLPSST